MPQSVMRVGLASTLLGPNARPAAIVAIPARNEAEHLPQCLAALASQQDRQGRALSSAHFGIVLLLNGGRDASAAVAERAARTSRFPLWTVDLPSSDLTPHAGAARRLAMELAAGWLDKGRNEAGVILTTDADSCVEPTWVADNLAAFARGADAVAGRIVLDAQDDARLSEALRARGRLEERYGRLLAELAALLDPVGWDPWPNHWTNSGASLAVRVAAYRSVGGMPPLPVGEDGAFVGLLEQGGFRVRHDPTIVVTTSGRLVGRASGGAADTMRMRQADPDAPCDSRLEAPDAAVRRFALRARLRRLFQVGATQASADELRRLGLATIAVGRHTHFASLWQAAEADSPQLAHEPLRPSQLPVAIANAEHILANLRREALLPARALELRDLRPISLESRAPAHQAGSSRSVQCEQQPVPARFAG